MQTLRALAKHALRDVEDDRRLFLVRKYRRMLRRALVLGWNGAKSEYLPRERDLGRDPKEIMADLAFFEELNYLARREGVDPVEMQRRVDLYKHAFRPITVVASGLLVAAMAASSVAAPWAIAIAVSACWLSLRTTRALLVIE